MLRRKHSWLRLLWSCAAVAANGASAPGSLKILDWNIDSGARSARIVETIKREKPDLCLFQEVDWNTRRAGFKNVAEELARRFGMQYVFGKEFHEVGQGENALQGQAILSRYPLRSTREIRFANQSDFWEPRPYLPNWSMMQRRLGGRMAQVSELDFGGRTLAVYNTHLESRGDVPLRLKQLEEILADTKRYPPGTPIVIAGDLNTKYHPSPLIERLTESGFQDAVNSGRPTRTSMWWVSLDWIFVRGPIGFEGGAVDHKVRASDHYPITVRITAK